MKFINNIITFTAAIAIAKGITLKQEESKEESTTAERIGQAVTVVTDVAPAISDAVANIVDAASGNVHGACWKNSYVVRPEFGNTCLDGWSKGGALCYENCDEGFQHDGPGGTICFECHEEYTLIGGICWKGWRSHIPLDTYGRGIEGQRCRPGTVRQGALCYEEPTERFTLIGGVAWEHCTGDVPHECGAMCTRDAATCSQRVKEQAMSIFGLVTDALS